MPQPAKPFQRFADSGFAWRRFAVTLVLLSLLALVWHHFGLDDRPPYDGPLIEYQIADPTPVDAPAHLQQRDAARPDTPAVKRTPVAKIPDVGKCDDPATTPVISFEEFDKHDCDTKDLWVLIDGFVYDVWAFRTCARERVRVRIAGRSLTRARCTVPQHPGSDAICAGAHIDGSTTFNALHPPWVRRHMLSKYCIGRIDSIPDKARVSAQ